MQLYYTPDSSPLFISSSLRDNKMRKSTGSSTLENVFYNEFVYILNLLSKPILTSQFTSVSVILRSDSFRKICSILSTMDDIHS